MAKRDDVLGPQLPVLEPRRDRLVGAALVLVGLRELFSRLRVERARRDSLLRRGDRRAGRAAVAEGVTHQLPQVETARADAEEDEAAREDDDQKHECPLRLAAQAREEHRVLCYARGAATGAASAAGGTASIALSAAAVSSCHSIPPLS